MSDKILYIAADNLIEYGADGDVMKNAATGAVVTTATVTWVVKDSSGVAVSGANGTCAHVAGGLYQGTMESTQSDDLTLDALYTLEITVVASTLNDFRKIPCVAKYRVE